MIHETAIIDDCTIGEGTKIWAFSHVSSGAIIGKNCVIGEGVHIGPNVIIGPDVFIEKSVISNTVILSDSKIYGTTINNSIIGPNISLNHDVENTIIAPEGEKIF